MPSAPRAIARSASVSEPVRQPAPLPAVPSSARWKPSRSPEESLTAAITLACASSPSSDDGSL